MFSFWATDQDPKSRKDLPILLLFQFSRAISVWWHLWFNEIDDVIKPWLRYFRMGSFQRRLQPLWHIFLIRRYDCLGNGCCGMQWWLLSGVGRLLKPFYQETDTKKLARFAVEFVIYFFVKWPSFWFCSCKSVFV